MRHRLVLASASHSRRSLLTNAGLSFDSVPADIDERAVEAQLDRNSLPGVVALALAKAKALDVAKGLSGTLIIGCDQVMSQGDEIFHKAPNLAAARQQLSKLKGKTHILSSAVALVRDDVCLWESVVEARMTCRDFSEDFLDIYIAEAGESILSSVGCYQLEGRGIQLFDRIEGDYFTILGLPLLPLLGALRDMGEIDA